MSHLHHTVIRGEDANPEKMCVMIHGILGAGMNLRTVARRMQEHHPKYWFVLPDLRGHGNSPGFDQPHSVRSCAEDILALERSLGGRAAIRIGHSFGGKVVLAMKEKSPVSTVVMDTLPGASQHSDPGRLWMNGLLTQLAKIPMPLSHRQELGAHLGPYGGSPSFEGWMGTNLRPNGQGGFQWRFKLPVIRALIDDYWRVDLTQLLDDAQNVHLLYGEHSERFTEAHLIELRARLGARLHCIQGAGHWLHVDNQADTVGTLCEIISSLK